LDNKAISHSLAGFSFSKDAFTFDDSTFLHDEIREEDDDDENEPVMMTEGTDHMDIGDSSEPVEDFFVGDQAVVDDFGGTGDIGPDEYGGDNNSNGSIAGEGDHGEGGRPGAFVPFDPRRVPNERDLVMAMTDADGEGVMDYFDLNFLKDWAGPEHWKLRKVIKRRAYLLVLLISCYLSWMLRSVL
jgi:condensin complex subunit 2